MEYKEQLEELKKQKRSEESIKQYESLLLQAKTERNTEAALSIIQQMVESMRYLRMHKEAIHFLETELELELYDGKEDHLALLEELIKTLLRTEDFMKLESVLMHRERFLTNEHQKVMQRFYLAVCYEGLNEYAKAIDALKGIKDTISASNLVSKYLKLSMLCLKENNIDQAKEHFEHAIKFDRGKRNPIFLLTESDILSAEGNYQDALIKYQEYFVKSKNKHRYLDRYIRINIELDRLDEAWRFYQEYLPSMKQVISKNYRLIFYESALELAKKLANKHETEVLEYLIEELAPEPPMLHTFDSVYRLLSYGFKAKRFSKARDVVHHIFHSMDSIYPFSKLVFLTPYQDHYILYHYSKGLLLEKEFNSMMFSDTILEHIIEQKALTKLYGYEEIITYPRGLYKTVETMYVFANGISREAEFDHFIAYSNELDHFDMQQKLVLLASELLRKLLFDFDRYHIVDMRLNEYSQLIDRLDGGIIRIDQNMIHFENQIAKDLLHVTTDYLAFEEFQQRLKKQLFLDDFLYTDRLVFTLKNEESIECFIAKNDFTIHGFIRPVLQLEEVISQNLFYPLPDERQLLQDFAVCKEPVTLCLIEIRNHRDYLRDYNHENYKAKLKDLEEALRLLSKQHFGGLYLESFSYLYLVILNIDKRVTKRISDLVCKELSELDLRISLLQANHSVRTDKLIQLKYLNALTGTSNPVIYDNKNFRYNQELSKTILLNVNKFIEAKRIPLTFTSIHHLSSNKIGLYQVDVSASAMLGEESTLNRVLDSAGLHLEWDYLVIHSLSLIVKQQPSQTGFVVLLSEDTWNDKKQLAKIQRKIKDLPILLAVDFSTNVPKETILEMKEKHLSLYARNCLNHMSPNRIDILFHFDYIQLQMNDLGLKNINRFLNLFDTSTAFVLQYANQTLKRSDLEPYRIDYVIGGASEKHESVTISKTSS